VKTLFAYQRAAVGFCNQVKNPALFMEMRLGKTLTAIRALAWERERKLVVAPLPVLATWAEELDGEGRSWVDLHSWKEKDGASSADWMLINYEALRSRWKDLLHVRWGAVILDESTRIKNPKAIVTKAILAGFTDVNRRFLLSGLPALEGDLDYACQMLFLNGSFLGCKNYWETRARYFRKAGYEWLPRPGLKAKLKEYLEQRAFVLTRKSAGVGRQKVHSKRVVPSTPRQRKLTAEVKKEFRLKEDRTKWVTTKFIWLARIAGGQLADGEQISDEKSKELVSLHKGELSGQSLVVFFRFNKELQAVRRYLGQKGIKCCALTGATSNEERTEVRRRFQRGAFPILLAQIKVAKFGLDLSRASTAIYYSNSYSLEERAQTEDRIIHPKKNEPPLYIDLVTAGSVDEQVVRILQEKNFESRFLLNRLAREVEAAWT